VFCLANQDSPWFTRIFGGAAGNEGLGTFSLCLDWAYVGSGGGAIGSLFTPLSTQLSLYAGCAVCMITFSCCYYYNTWNAQQFPFLTQLLFYPNGSRYDQLLILNDDFTLNNTKLAVQGLPMYAASQLMSKISRIMYIGAAVTHFALWHGKDVYHLIKKSTIEEETDVHYQKMKVYNEVPWYWYMTTFVVCSSVGLGTAYAAKSTMPWWAFFVAIFFAAIFIPVIGTVSVLCSSHVFRD
jgi:hypothetical protein